MPAPGAGQVGQKRAPTLLVHKRSRCPFLPDYPRFPYIKTVLDKLGKSEELISYVSDRPGHDRRYASDPTKIHKELGWLRGMSQIWNYFPMNLLKIDQGFLDVRLVNIFGVKLTSWDSSDPYCQDCRRHPCHAAAELL